MRRAALLLAVVVAAPAGAQTVVTSAAPSQVGVTVYRDANRGTGRMSRTWLNGYALISETRTLVLPAGESELRFEGVASGIIPQSAIVGGIPKGLLERNRDAFLLSAGSLVDRSLGERVSLRRTDRATGKVSVEEAVVRSDSNRGVVLQTAGGFEALRCSGLAETLVYPDVPEGLSARPTLSVRVRARQPLSATVTLSYLASGFDWQADYVALLSADEKRLHLQAWLTLASTDQTSFVAATTQAVAGRVNRERADVPPAQAPALRLECWPSETTSDIESTETVREEDYFGPPPPPPPAPPPPPPPAAAIVVTGSRITAQREQLGDLQLYRIPEPVTVAAKAQKQVGLLDRPAVRVRAIYEVGIEAGGETRESEAQLVLRSMNRDADGLGLPLPAGNVVLFREGAERPLLIGEAPLRDAAVGEKVELRLDRSGGVRARLSSVDQERRTLVLTNDRSTPSDIEVELYLADGQRIDGSGLVRRDGRTLWVVTVPANGTATLNYRLRRA